MTKIETYAILAFAIAIAAILFVYVVVILGSNDEAYGFLKDTNATDINWGIPAMTDDDNLEEEEEREDEKEHERESKEYYKD